jgi:DNA polymerase-3 subunit gamma/tau
MVGQQHVLRALVNALEDDRLHHAYLFTGTRGVGKTTIARILAKCLNCEKGVTSEPCGECSSCKSIAEGSFVDLIEVDAASRTKVEDTRELLDNVQYAPTRGRFKVYLIDEVHMLTGHSFNALLKTLEEPPPHVKFLFATTDPQKLPVTILSRCLQFNLKRMPVDMILGHLRYLTEQESINSDEASLKLIARAADGSMRDALSLLDQSIAFGGGELKEADVREMLGTISHEPLLKLIKSVAAGDGAAIIQHIEDMASTTPDFEAATDAMIALLHQVAVQQVVTDAVQDDDAIAELAGLLSKEDVQLYYQITLHGRRDLPLSPDPRSGFEMLMLRMLSFRPLQAGMKLHTLPEAVEASGQDKKKSIKNKTHAVTPAAVKTDSKKTDSSSKRIKNQLADDVPPWESLPQELDVNDHPESRDKPNKPATQTAKQNGKAQNTGEKIITKKDQQADWHDIVPKLNLQGRAAELIKHSLFENMNNGIITLSLDESSEGLLADSVKQEIETALSAYYQQPLTLKLDVVAIDQDSTKLTPAQNTRKVLDDKQRNAEQTIATDPFVVELQNRFGGKIVPGSIQTKD